jgi:hypothetical protein
MSNKVSNAFTTIREKFHHIAVLGGPQYAAVLRMRNSDGRLYVSEFGQWLWSPRSGLASRIVTNQDLENLVSPIELCRTLLLSAQDTMINLLHQMDCVEAHVHRNRALWKVPGISQTDVIINELFRLQVQSATPKSTSVM